MKKKNKKKNLDEEQLSEVYADFLDPICTSVSVYLINVLARQLKNFHSASALGYST